MSLAKLGEEEVKAEPAGAPAVVARLMVWRPYAEGKHADVPEIARDRAIFDWDVWIHCWNHSHFQQISRAVWQLGRLQARPSPPPHRVWRETRGGGSRARHCVDVYGPQLLDWAHCVSLLRRTLQRRMRWSGLRG